MHPSINAAYKAKANELNVTRNAIYAKLNGVEPSVSAALLRERTAELAALVRQMGGSKCRSWKTIKSGYSMAMP